MGNSGLRRIFVFAVSLVNSSCMVENKELGFKIDLTPLRELGVQTIQSGDFEYDITVCAPLPDKYKCLEETSVCRRSLKDKRQQTPLGKDSSELTYNSGYATVLYQGVNESSSIMFTCDFNAQVGAPRVLETQSKFTAFEWATAFACPSMNAHHQSCMVFPKDNSNHLFDLSRLSRVKEGKDWVFDSQDPKDPTIKLRFYVNVCRPLNNPPKGCNPLASVCVETIYPDKTRKVADAGHAVDPPVSEGGQLMLNYSNGDHCVHRGLNATRRTVIYFLCGDDVEGGGGTGEYLQFVGELGCSPLREVSIRNWNCFHLTSWRDILVAEFE